MIAEALRRSNLARVAHRAISPVWNPVSAIHALTAYPRFVRDAVRYAALPNAERLSLLRIYPCLLDRTDRLPIDAHYFYANGWATRRIVQASPRRHVDVSSLLGFAGVLSGLVPVVYLEYRPLAHSLSGLSSVATDIKRLPFQDRSLESVSSLHVIEHIGLGRYGDALDPEGTIKAARELSRVVKPGGNLYVAVPVGARAVWFNAHRVFRAAEVEEMFADLDLVDFAGVSDASEYRERAAISAFDSCRYACGMFQFRRPL